MGPSARGYQNSCLVSENAAKLLDFQSNFGFGGGCLGGSRAAELVPLQPVHGTPDVQVGVIPLRIAMNGILEVGVVDVGDLPGEGLGDGVFGRHRAESVVGPAFP